MTTLLRDVELTDDLLALIAERAADADRAGAIDPEVVAGLRASGLYRLFRPTELGGLSASPRRSVELVERIAAADGSVAWTSAIGFGSNLFAGYVDRNGAAEVFADPDASNASMFAPMAGAVPDADGTLRISGRWPFVSGCQQAAWVGLGALFDGDLAPRLVFVPRATVTVHDTWDVAGMRATGSHDVSVDDHPVDLRRTCCFTDRPWAEGPLWRLPLFTVLGPPLAAVALGIARGALDEVNRQAMARRQQMRGSLLDDLVGMADLGAADALLRGARAGLLDALDTCWSLATEGVPIDRPLQARTFLAVQHCTDVAVEVAGTAHRLGGGAGAYRGSPLLRAVRDLETLRQHAMFNRGLRPHLARVVAGVDEMHPPFVI